MSCFLRISPTNMVRKGNKANICCYSHSMLSELCHKQTLMYSCKHEKNAILWCVQTVKKYSLVANLPVTLRYIIVVCPGIRSESNLFQTFSSLAGMKHSLLEYELITCF